MKVLLLGFAKIKYLPYMHFYLNCIDNKNSEIHLVYWERDLESDDRAPDYLIIHCYKCIMSDLIPLYKKVIPIINYGKFAKKVINSVKPDILIVLHSTTAISIYNLLTGLYKGKYIFDFRDLTYEKYPVYRKMISKIIKNSILSFTSSDGFRKMLPTDEKKLLTSHNLLRSSLEKHEQYYIRNKRNLDQPIRIAFWGMIRHVSINEEIIKKLGNDERFELHFYGRAGDEMNALLTRAEKEYHNVKYHGEYLPAERDAFSLNTDLIHNIYGNNDKTTYAAMGNKYYDGLVYYLPQLCMKDSFMGVQVTENRIGLACDPYSDGFSDSIFQYYRSLDFEVFKKNCDSTLDKVVRQIEKDEVILKRVLSDYQN